MPNPISASRRTASFLARSIVCLCLTTAAAEAQTHHYTATVDPGLKRLTMRVCFEGEPPPRLVSGLRNAHRFLIGAHTSGTNKTTRLDISHRGIRLGQLPAHSCIRYQIDLARAYRGGSLRTGIALVKDALVAPAGLWLWQPVELGDDEELEINFQLPEGYSVSVPWTPLDLEAQRYRLARTPLYWPAHTAIGRFVSTDLEVPGATLRVALLDGDPPAETEFVHAWLGEAAMAVTTLYGRFPLPSPQVLVIPIGSGNEAVPWAHVVRGGGASARFFINQRLPLEEFRGDWTATHELSHMLLPYLGNEGSWLSEGFASYYQNVLRARNGMLTEQQAWQKLHDGFQRGIEQTSNKGTLESISRRMHRQRAYMRVYWSGAAIALLADVRLRQQSNGQKSLDTALDKLQRCCLPADQRWRPETLLTRLDELTDSDVFTNLADTWLESADFPDVSNVYGALGIRISDDRVGLSDRAPLAGIRTQIMRASSSSLAQKEAGSAESQASW